MSSRVGPGSRYCGERNCLVRRIQVRAGLVAAARTTRPTAGGDSAADRAGDRQCGHFNTRAGSARVAARVLDPAAGHSAPAGLESSRPARDRDQCAPVRCRRRSIRRECAPDHDVADPRRRDCGQGSGQGPGDHRQFRLGREAARGRRDDPRRRPPEGGLWRPRADRAQWRTRDADAAAHPAEGRPPDAVCRRCRSRSRQPRATTPPCWRGWCACNRFSIRAN